MGSTSSKELLSAAPDSLPAAYATDDRIAIRDLARRFAMTEVLPIANRLDPIKGEIPMELRAVMAEMGFFGILIPEEFGGLGLGVFEYCLVTEELARAWMSVASIIARGNGLGDGFTAKQRREILPRMAAGECLGAFALSEPDVGSDAAAVRCRAVRVDDTYVINGQKMWCTFADGADFLIVVARTQAYDPADRHAGIQRFFIPKDRGTFPPGVTGTAMPKIGYHGWRTWELSFQDVVVPADAMLGSDKSGATGGSDSFDGVTDFLAVAHVHTAARSIGLARAALEDSVAYCQQRRQFERAIGDFQALRFKIADMATEIEVARALMYQVASDADAGRDVTATAAMLKFYASEMSERVTSQGIQIHGGAGYTTEFTLERHWRDARLTKIFEGTSEIQQKIVSDHYLPRPRR